MIVKDVMRKTLIKHYENDYIESVIRKVIAREDEGGLVYNEKDELVGCFTYKELLQGVGRKAKTLQCVYVVPNEIVEENNAIETPQFKKSDICPVRSKNGDITGFITKADYLKAIARTAKVERNQLDAIFNSAHSGILSIDLEGRITAMNPSAENMSLMSSGQAIGKFLTDVVNPSGLLDVIRTGKGHSEKYKVGSRVYLTRRSPIFKEHELVGAVGVFQDVSELEVVSQELDSAKQLKGELEAIMNYSSDGICIANERGKVIRQNAKFQELISEHSFKDTDEKILSIIEKVAESGVACQATQLEAKKAQSLMVVGHPVKSKAGDVERVIVNVKKMTDLERFRYRLHETGESPNYLRKKSNEIAFVSESIATKEVVSRAKKLAKTDVTILLTGEKGVGKETLAKFIHNNSSRKQKPFVKVDCSTISKEQMAYELFGFEYDERSEDFKSSKTGYFEQANGGTIYLNEIGQMSISMQSELLRVLQEQKITKIGTNENKRIDVRIIASSSKNLELLIEMKEFREDLYYRINVIPLHIPPLRERLKDLWGLIESFAQSYSTLYGSKIKLTEEVMGSLVKYKWPGNIEELKYVLEKLYATSSSEAITQKGINKLLKSECADKKEKQPIIVNEVIPLREAVAELERLLITKAGETEDSYRKIAKVLEVSPSTIIRKLRRGQVQD